MRISGVTGFNALVVNGIYEPTSEKCGKSMLPKYVKIIDANQTLQYVSGTIQCYWCSKGIDSVNKGEPGEAYGQGYCRVKKNCPPEDCTASKWEVAEGNAKSMSDFKRQAGVTISIVSQSELEAHRAWVAAEAARKIIGTKHVRLVGVKLFPAGLKTNLLQGVFEPTSELCNGVTRYRNLETDHLLEYHAGTGQWQIKPKEAKGTKIAFAHCAVPSKCLPEECPAGQWRRIADAEGLYNLALEPSCKVEIVSPQEAEASTLQTVATALNISIASPGPALGPRKDVEPLHLYLREDGLYSPGVFYERMFQLLNMEEVELAADFEFVKSQVLARLKRYTDVVRGMMKNGTKGVKVRMSKSIVVVYCSHFSFLSKCLVHSTLCVPPVAPLPPS